MGLKKEIIELQLEYDSQCLSLLSVSFIFAFTLISKSSSFYLSSAVRKEDQPLPYLLYLEGGPGFESPRPTEISGRIGKLCEEYRVILLDQACCRPFLRQHKSHRLYANVFKMQRGTGLSTSLI